MDMGTPTEAESRFLEKEVNRVALLLNEFYRQNHFDDLISQLPVEGGITSVFGMVPWKSSISLETKGLKLDCNRQDKKLSLVFVDTPKAKKRKSSFHWNPETIVDTALEFAKIFWTDSCMRMGKGELRLWAKRVWRIEFPRTSEQGIPFEDDGSTVLVDERFGPYMVSQSLISNYFYQGDFKISKEEGLAAARITAETLLKDPYFFELGRSRPMAINELVSIDLKIANPQSLVPTRPGKGDAQYSQDAQLSWVATFRITNSAPSRNFYQSAIRVYVNAISGKVIGGREGPFLRISD